MRPISNVVGFDDGPFVRDSLEPVRLVGAICARTRLDGVVSGWVQRNGEDATERMSELIEHSQFADYVRAVLIKGIAVGGFNVIDIHELSQRLGVPVVVVSRKFPDYPAIRAALVAAGLDVERTWQLIERAGTPQAMRSLWVQSVGLAPEAVSALLGAVTLHGKLPEALRLAHLIAGGVTRGVSRGRA